MEKSQSKCAVIGYGSWATAIVKIFAENGVRVAWHILNPEVLASVREEGRNCKYLRDVDLDTSRMELSDDINTVVRDADTVVMAMPSAFTKTFLEPLTTPLADKTVISAVKGIVPDEYLSVAGYLIRRYDIPEHQMALVTGPSHAEEVGMGRLSYLTVVGTDPTLREQVAHMFERPYIRISHSEDIFGVEYAAIMKNIYALAVGMAVGLGYGDNFIAVLIANCAAEMELPRRTRPPAAQHLRVGVSGRPAGDKLLDLQPQPPPRPAHRPRLHRAQRHERDDDGGRGVLRRRMHTTHRVALRHRAADSRYGLRDTLP